MLCSFDKFVETGRDSRNYSKKFFLTNLDARHCVLSRATFACSSRAVKKLNGATLILRQRYCKVHIAFL